MNISRTLFVRLPLLLVALVFLIPACSQETPVALPDSDSGLEKGGEPLASYSLQVVDGASVTAIAGQYGFTLDYYDEDEGLGTYSTFPGNPDIGHLEQNVQVEHTGPFQPVSYVGPVNELIGFFQDLYPPPGELPGHEGPWTDDLYFTQPSLAWMDLEDVVDEQSANAPVVAIIDTGVDDRHPHLAGNVDAVSHWQVNWKVLAETEYAPLDPEGDNAAFGHGTYLAGLIVGMAPEARIISIKILDDEGLGYDVHLAHALDVARAEGADIVNLSLIVEGGESPIVEKRLAQMAAEGTTIIAAAGNNNGGTLEYPASSPYVISAGSVDVDGSPTGISSFSAINADFGAPGRMVVSSYPLGDAGEVQLSWASGTSTATAVVSGAFAALYNHQPGGNKTLAPTALPFPGFTLGLVSPYDAMGLP